MKSRRNGPQLSSRHDDDDDEFCPSVRPSVCPVSRPDTESSPGEIETPGFHDMVAWGL